jgi:hypothetical protein
MVVVKLHRPVIAGQGRRKPIPVPDSKILLELLSKKLRTALFYYRMRRHYLNLCYYEVSNAELAAYVPWKVTDLDQRVDVPALCCLMWSARAALLLCGGTLAARKAELMKQNVQ